MGCEDGSCCAQGAKREGTIFFPGTDDHDTPWKFYSHLIGGIPEDVLVTGCCLGTQWNYVDAECGMGVSFSAAGGGRRTYAMDFIGLPLRDMAELSKSWNFAEASLGVAALNAWYSQPDKLEELGAIYDPGDVDEGGKPRKSDVFEVYRERYTGKKVTVIGHFPHVERVSEVAELTVLERNCTSSIDVPDPACEYVIPKTDYLFMTGVTIINKTAPRLLTLGKNAVTVFVGPSTVPSSFLFRWDVDCLAGSVVVDKERTKTMVEQGAGMMFHDALRMFRIERPAD